MIIARRMKTILAVAAAGALVAGVGGPLLSYSPARIEEAKVAPVSSSASNDTNLVALENALRVIDSIPKDVSAQGDQASMEWLQHNYGAPPSGGASPYAFNWAKCSAGIAVAIGSNTIAVVKVLKIKRAIDKLGGVGKIIAKLQEKQKQGKKFKAALFEAFEESGAGMGALAAEILGIDGVINNCW